MLSSSDLIDIHPNVKKILQLNSNDCIDFTLLVTVFPISHNDHKAKSTEHVGKVHDGY